MTEIEKLNIDFISTRNHFGKKELFLIMTDILTINFTWILIRN